MKEKQQKKAAVLMGSVSDEAVMQECIKALDFFGIPCEKHVLSAHRNPDEVDRFSREAESRGFSVIIAAAGMAAALPGVVASRTVLPVIGVPLEGSALSGMDALLSMVQMPAGIPVATVAIGKAGARNAGILAAEILALADGEIRRKLEDFRKAGSKF
ncbi:5-(carboxyamino)imidazole ribonucleotide mutase [bacterium]|nr:5-(carboxyamino)imidazole ribonucleotide mutase [bacterium]